jgi:phosphomannomutase/phosphoglucomutase
LLRASNTSPYLILRFEADNLPALQRIQTLFSNALLAMDPSLKLPF